MLGLWYYFFNTADWTQDVVGTADFAQAKQEILAFGTVSEVVPLAGGWAEYEHVLSLNRPHWSAPRPQKLPALVPKPVEEPQPIVITGYGACEQRPGEIVAWGEVVDVELELIAALMAAVA